METPAPGVTLPRRSLRACSNFIQPRRFRTCSWPSICKDRLRKLESRGWESEHAPPNDGQDRQLENNDAHLVIDCRSLSGSRRSMPRWPPSTSSFRFNRPLRARRNRSSARCDREAPGGRRTRLSCGLGDPLRPCAALAPAEGDARHSSSISPQGNSSNLSRGLPHERSQHGRGGRRSGVRARSTRDQWATRSSG